MDNTATIQATAPSDRDTLRDAYALIADDLEQVRVLFDEELRSNFDFVNDLCETVRSYRGKMLRPALLLLSGRACGSIRSAHHTLAAVVEMVHMATLVHDDVLDEATERRCRPTIRTMAGNTGAVLLGDYLISHSFHLCSRLDSQHASRRIGHTTNVVCEGELMQNARRHDAALSEADYFEIIRRKTGALTAVACELGAWCAGSDQKTVAALYEYGMSVGVAFQIVDDVLDVMGEEAEVGKTLGIDAALGKSTLPTIRFLAAADRDRANALCECLRGEATLQRTVLTEWLESTGSIDYALDHARQHVRRAIQQLLTLPESDARTSLEQLATFITRRRF